MAKKNKRKTREPVHEYEVPFEQEEYVEEQPRTKYRMTLSYLIDQDEVNSLIEASSAAYVEPPRPPMDVDYQTYTKEESTQLLSGDFTPVRSKKRK